MVKYVLNPRTIVTGQKIHGFVDHITIGGFTDICPEMVKIGILDFDFFKDIPGYTYFHVVSYIPFKSCLLTHES